MFIRQHTVRACGALEDDVMQGANIMTLFEKTFVLVLFFGAGLVLGTAPAIAQDTTDSEDYIEEILVTADKRSAKSVQDLGSSITAFDANKLERLDALDFDDFITQVPGTNFLNDGGPGRGNEVASIRGLSAVADNTVGVVSQYLDGAPHFGSSYRLFDIAEAAVMRGPQGTLWGSQSIGGLIYFRSNRPDPTGFDGSIQADMYDTKDDSGLSSRLSGVVNIPLVEDVFAIRIAGHVVDESGFISNVRTSTGGINNVQESAWRVSALWNMSDNATATVIYHGNDLDADAPTYIDLAVPGRAVDQPSDRGPATQQYDLVNLILDVDFGWGSLGYTGSVFSNKGGHSDYAGDIGALALSERNLDEDATTHEIRLASNAENALPWIVGFYSDDYEDFDEAVDWSLLDFDDPAPVEGIRSGGLIKRQDQAFFGEVSYDFTDKLRLLVGGRFFDWEVDNSEVFLIGGGDFGFVTNGVASDRDFFSKFLVEYRFNDDVMAYGSRSEGFRYGGFNTFVGEALFGISEEFFEFGPDTLVSYELGVKSAFADNRALLNASVYFLDWQEVQAVVQSDTAGAFGQGFFTTNAPDLEATGLEVELTTQDLIAPGVYAAMTWAYTDNEFQDSAQLFPGTVTTIEKGDSLRRTVRNSYSLDVGYDFDMGQASAFVRANYWHKDSTNSAGYNRFDGDVEIPAQDVVNFSLGAAWEKFMVKFYVDNVTDEIPMLNVLTNAPRGTPGSNIATVTNTIRPRTIGLEGTFYFGAGR